MAKSNRRRKQDRAKASTRQTETRRRRARTAATRAVPQRVCAGGWLTPRIKEASPLRRPTGAAKLMLAADDGGQDPSPLTAVTFAAAVAGAAGDSAQERRLIDLALAATEVPAAAEAADSLVERLKVLHFISSSGHPAEAVELLEPLLREAPDDDYAAEIYGTAISAAYAQASEAGPGEGERERAA